MSKSFESKLLNHIIYIKKYGSSHAVAYKIKLFIQSSIAFLLQTYKINIVKTPCDLLIVARSTRSYTYKHFEKLLPNNLSYKIIVEQKGLEIIKKGLIYKINKKSLFLNMYYAYSSWIIHKYSPKIIITENDGSLLCPILKSDSKRYGISMIHIAHSVPTKNKRIFSLIDYDNYFVYGKSSIDYILSRDRTLGSCNFKITGSWIIQHRLQTRSNINFSKNIKSYFLLLGSGPEYESTDETKKIYQLVINYVLSLKSAGLIFKPHPRSNKKLWESLIVSHEKNKFIISEYFPKDTSKILMGFCGYTNSILDLSYLNIPPILINLSKNDDYFDYEKYFGSAVVDFDELIPKIDYVLNNRHLITKKTKEFTEYHLSSIKDPIENMKILIASFIT